MQQLTDDQLVRKRSGLTPADLDRKRQVRRWRIRKHKARRINGRERSSLGLQPHVGADDFDIERARYYRALEHLIAREIRDAHLRPLMQIGFDGRPAPVLVSEPVEVRDPDAHLEWRSQHAVRNTSSTPLDYMYFQSKSGIEWWEWVAGKRMQYDWHVAQAGHTVTASLDALMLARVKPLTRAERKRERLRPTTFPPRRAKRAKAGPVNLSDRRLDASARLGRLAGSISNVAFFLLEAMIGHERWANDVAGQLGEKPEYISRRFREALCEAAAHYRLGPSSRPRSR